MKYIDLLEVSANKIIKDKIYYHGTSSVVFANNIIKNGIKPPDISINRLLTPVKGKIYVTHDISYALIYAVGGSYLDEDYLKIPYKGNETEFEHIFNDDKNSRRYGRYGYLFIINGDDLNDVQPDEDSIGSILHMYLNNRPTDEYIDAFNDNALKSEIMHIVNKRISPNTLKRVKEGEYAYYAKTGKIIVKWLSDISKLRLIQYGSHIAHHGELKPSSVWKIDKTKIGYIKKDGVNLAQYAKLINLK